MATNNRNHLSVEMFYQLAALMVLVFVSGNLPVLEQEEHHTKEYQISHSSTEEELKLERTKRGLGSLLGLSRDKRGAQSAVIFLHGLGPALSGF